MTRALTAITLIVLAYPCCAADLRLIEAVKAHDSNATHSLLNEQIDVNTAYGDGSTALHWAAQWDDIDVAQALLARGAVVNRATDLGIVPLALACGNGSVQMTKMLLDAGADPNLRAVTGITPLMMCARAGNAESVAALVAHRAAINEKENAHDQTALMWAISERHPEVVKVLIEAGADVHLRTREDSLLVNKGELSYGKSVTELTETGGSTALIFAARVGDVESAALLIAAGANPNETAADKTSALAIAALSGQTAVAALLLRKDATPDAGAGYTALAAAAMRGDAELVRALLAAGALTEIPLASGTTVRRSGPDYALPAAMRGATPYLIAAKYGWGDVMRILAAGGANPRAALKDGTTALMAAASADRVAVHETYGALPASDQRALDAVKAAIDLGSDINAANSSGETALHIATARGYNSVIEWLVKNGADIEAKNNRGQTPLRLTGSSLSRGSADQPPSLKVTADLLRKLGAKD
jgi:ankyrin repeat protein